MPSSRVFKHKAAQKLQNGPPNASPHQISAHRCFEGTMPPGYENQTSTIYIKTGSAWVVEELDANGVVNSQAFQAGEYRLVITPNSPGLQAIIIDPDPGPGTGKP